MSISQASSRGGIDHSRAFQNGFLPNPIFRFFNRAAIDKIHSSAQQFFQFQFHLRVIQQAVLSMRRKSEQEIDVAVGPKVVSQYGAE